MWSSLATATHRGIAPLMVRAGPHDGLSVCKLDLLHNDHTAARRTGSSSVRRRDLPRCGTRSRALAIAGIAATEPPSGDSPTRATVSALADATGALTGNWRETSLRTDLRGTWDSYWASRTRSSDSNLRNRLALCAVR
jgi:hypothetical protein